LLNLSKNSIQNSFIHSSWYWIIHIIAVAIVLVLPGGSTKKPRPGAEVKQPDAVKQPQEEQKLELVADKKSD
jgi:hypothetical protein